ncbi:MAG: hypothetical protein GEV28_31615 [Actinophytocola sp.]|nr:hypothetical protein [Actinophytocola sp.]
MSTPHVAPDDREAPPGSGQVLPAANRPTAAPTTRVAPTTGQAPSGGGSGAGQVASAWQRLEDAWRDTDLLALPLPPAPPGERGYRPGDVERLVKLLADAVTDPGDGPGPDDIAGVKLSRTFFIGQGYHSGAVEALRLAWVNELRRRQL